MKKEFNYISDEDLEQLMLQVEQNELVAAPPDLMERILETAGRMKKKEFYAYCFRVITSVAAAIALVFLLPELSAQMRRAEIMPEFPKQEIPRYEEVADAMPSKDEVILAMQAPTKEEVLGDAGFVERVLNNTGWFNKQHSEE